MSCRCEGAPQTRTLTATAALGREPLLRGHMHLIAILPMSLRLRLSLSPRLR